MAAGVSGTTPAPPKTRLDKENAAQKKEQNRLAVQKHGAKQTTQKRREVNEKRMTRYYKQKDERTAVHKEKTEKAVQANIYILLKTS